MTCPIIAALQILKIALRSWLANAFQCHVNILPNFLITTNPCHTADVPMSDAEEISRADSQHTE